MELAGAVLAVLAALVLDVAQARLAERCERWYCDPEGFAQKQRP